MSNYKTYKVSSNMTIYFVHKKSAESFEHYLYIQDWERMAAVSDFVVERGRVVKHSVVDGEVLVNMFINTLGHLYE